MHENREISCTSCSKEQDRSAKAINRTADMDVQEKSDCAQARWSSTSQEIFYRSGQKMMAVALGASGSEPTFGKPRAVFSDNYDFGQNVTIANYDVTRDGRFIMLRAAHSGSLRVAIHWTEELKQILAAGGVH